LQRPQHQFCTVQLLRNKARFRRHDRSSDHEKENSWSRNKNEDRSEPNADDRKKQTYEPRDNGLSVSSAAAFVMPILKTSARFSPL